LTERPGYLRLFAQDSPGAGNNLWTMPSILLQKIPAPAFILQTELELPDPLPGVTAGLVMFGEDYAWIGVRQRQPGGELDIGFGSCFNARTGCEENFQKDATVSSRKLTLRMTVAEGGNTVFSYRQRDGRFKAIGELFQARPGRWVGAKVGLFVRNNDLEDSEGFIDFNDFEFVQPRRN
jgi:hypothetical protein